MSPDFFNVRAYRWKKLSGYSGRKIIFRASGVVITEYVVDVNHDSLSGRKLAFITDMHWPGDPAVAEGVKLCIDFCKPDWIVCGGDMVTYSSHLNDAMRILADFHASTAKFAVLGNWDKRRYRWLPHRVWRDAYKKAGYRLLVNEGLISDGLFIYGTDDINSGHPRFAKYRSGLFSVTVTHNPDAIVRASNEELGVTDLVISGHTHSGQIRLPFFGAIRTSSRYWKKFEYGILRHKQTGTHMAVSAGTGTIYLPFRFLCEPEVLLISFMKRK